MIEIILTALSLALDAFAISVTNGLTVKGFSFKHALLMGLYFGGFQFIMPLIGWFCGSAVSSYISGVGNIVAFFLLAGIGVKMIWDCVRSSGDGAGLIKLTHARLAIMAVATSIDALAVGFGYALIDINVWIASGIIGLVAFILSVLGGMFGSKLPAVIRKRANFIGGIVLIAIGIKILAF